MVELLSHRGPDAAAAWVDATEQVYLGHRRLTIRDAAGGGQPMWNHDRTVCIIFNGEIYNHNELRRELVNRRHIFTSDHSDTEVVLHGYEEWRELLPQRLDGMFGFAIYDARRMCIFLACDRFAEKPVFYTLQSGGAFFAFASEVRALLAHRNVERHFDSAGLQKLLAYGFLPSPSTLHASVNKLPNGSWLEYSICTGIIRSQRYWRFALQPDESQIDEHSLADELRHRLQIALRRRQVSDVPVGYLLSSGVDSSAIASMAARDVGAHPIKTFTLAVNDAAFDEAAEAAYFASKLGAKHHERRWGVDEFSQTASFALSRLGEPITDMTLLPSVVLCGLARQHVKVVLTGEGADELFAGYAQFAALPSAQRYQSYVPARLKGLIIRLARRFPAHWLSGNGGDNLKRGLAALSYGSALWNPIWLSALIPGDIDRLFEYPLEVDELFDDAIRTWINSERSDSGSRTIEYFMNFYLPFHQMPRMDQASMLTSLEARTVFLDNDVVDFCARLPYRYKYQKSAAKYLLKRAMRPFLPESVLDRPKRGFDIPLGRWLSLSDFGAESIDLPGLRRATLRKFEREHLTGRSDHGRLFWALHVANEFAHLPHPPAESSGWNPMAEENVGSGIASQFAPSARALVPA